MFKLYRLKRQLKIVTALKTQEVKDQNFKLAAAHRDTEKQMLREIADLESSRKITAMVKSLSFLRQSEYMCGIYLQEKDSDIPIYLPYYYFSRELNHYLVCFFAEHPAFKFDWNEHPGKRKQMIKEVTEYYFITEILDHFTRSDCSYFKKKCKHELTRDDIKDAIQSNLFLRSFSVPVEQRKVFSEYANESVSNILVARNENNNPIGYYHKFYYTYPYSCELNRVSGGYEISTPFMKVRFQVKCDYEMRMPKDFCPLFLGFDKAKAPRIDVFIDTFVKWPAFIFPPYWRYFKTIRVLNKRLQESFSAENYFDHLGWKSIYIQSKIMENIIEKGRKYHV
jgi:hypothetical protein